MSIRHACVLSLVSLLAVRTLLAADAPDAAARSGMFKLKEIHVTDMTIRPNEAKPGEFLVAAKVTTAEEKNEVYGTINFGDGTPNFSFLGNDLPGLEDGISHFFAPGKIYEVTVRANTPFLSAQSITFLVLGRGFSFNAATGLGMQALGTEGAREAGGASPRYAAGVAKLTVLPGRTFATAATTTFSDVPGKEATVSGLSVSHTYTQKGIFVATTTTTNGTISKGRKMINVGAKDINESGALTDPPSFDIRFKKMQGKLDFAGTKSDAVSFSGTVQLPGGLDPARPDGNAITIGIGNIIDTVTVDAKGKATLPGSTGRITKMKVKWPKLEGPLTVGGETAQIDVTMSVPDMDTLGLDTEGITAKVRSDEANLKSVDRPIQMDIQLAGVPYETLVPVQYKRKVDKATGLGTAGQFKGIAGRQSQTQGVVTLNGR